MYCVDLEALKRKLEYDVREDIKEFGKHAFIYNFHHIVKQINAMDTEEMWEAEKKNLMGKGWDIRKEDKEIELNNKKWKVNLWIAQPLKKGKVEVDVKKYKKSTDFINDPLALCFGCMTSGFCYIELLDD